jgi:enterochelin esterase family protein
VEGFLNYFEGATTKRSEDITTIMMLALGACYSPDPSRPRGIGLPFDIGTGEINWTVWKRWKEWDPVEMVAHHADALSMLQLLFLDAGTRDEWSLDLGTRILAQRLSALKIPFEHQEFDDGHRGIAYRYDVSLPKMATALGAPPPGGGPTPVMARAR